MNYSHLKTLLIFFSFLILLQFSTFGQSGNFKAYQNAKDQERLNQAHLIYEVYNSENLDSLKILGEDLFFYGIDNGYQPAIEEGKIMLAEYLIQTGQVDKGIELLKPMLSLANEQNDIALKLKITRFITLGYCRLKDSKSAILWAKRIQLYKKNIHDPQEKLQGELLYAEALQLNNKSPEALKIYENYIQQAKKIHFNRGLSSAYAKLGDLYSKKGNFTKAKLYFEESFKYSKKTKLFSAQANAINNLAIINFEENKKSEALIYFTQALEIRQKANNPRGICESYYNLGDFYFYSENIPEAEKYYWLSKNTATKNNLTLDEKDALMALVKCKKSTMDYQTVVALQDEIIKLQERIHNQSIADNTELEELENELITPEDVHSKGSISNEKLLIPILSGALIAAISLLFFRKKTK